MVAQVAGSQSAHGAGEFGIHGLLGQGAQPAYEGGCLHRLGFGRGVVQERLEHVLGGEVQETGRDVFHLPPHLAQMAGDRLQRDACRMQFGGDGEFLRAGDVELVVTVRDAFQDAQGDGLGHGGIVGSAAEGGVQVGAADPGRLLVGPRPVDLGDQTEDAAEIATGVPGLQQFLDAGKGVAAVEQIGDLAQAGQMGVAVDVGPATAFGPRQQPAVLVGADGADRGAADVGQVLDAVFGRRRLLGHCGAPYAMPRYERAARPTAPAAARAAGEDAR